MEDRFAAAFSRDYAPTVPPSTLRRIGQRRRIQRRIVVGSASVLVVSLCVGGSFLSGLFSLTEHTKPPLASTPTSQTLTPSPASATPTPVVSASAETPAAPVTSAPAPASPRPTQTKEMVVGPLTTPSFDTGYLPGLSELGWKPGEISALQLGKAQASECSSLATPLGAPTMRLEMTGVPTVVRAQVIAGNGDTFLTTLRGELSARPGQVADVVTTETGGVTQREWLVEGDSCVAPVRASQVTMYRLLSTSSQSTLLTLTEPKERLSNSAQAMLNQFKVLTTSAVAHLTSPRQIASIAASDGVGPDRFPEARAIPGSWKSWVYERRSSTEAAVNLAGGTLATLTLTQSSPAGAAAELARVYGSAPTQMLPSGVKASVIEESWGASAAAVSGSTLAVVSNPQGSAGDVLGILALVVARLQ